MKTGPITPPLASESYGCQVEEIQVDFKNFKIFYVTPYLKFNNRTTDMLLQSGIIDEAFNLII